MDTAVFAFLTVAMATFVRKKRKHNHDVLSLHEWSSSSSELFYVTKENEPIILSEQKCNKDQHEYWHRATCVLVMYDPPEMFYEPKEWSHTTVLLWKKDKQNNNNQLSLPNGVLRSKESYISCASRHLQQDHGIDVYQPENCLHQLFTFAYQDISQNKRQWSDFMECVYRGRFDILKDTTSIVRMSLEELKDKLSDEPNTFDLSTHYALRLYFQRQMDLRAKRRLLKGYSSSDLEKYYYKSLRQHDSDTSSTSRSIIFRPDEHDSERKDALEYTMKTDDGMSPRLLQAADVVLLGVSRAGKTPLSLLLSQTKGVKVANVPLVLEVPPPRQLFDKVDPKRVFCITQQADHLVQVRRNRLRRELMKRIGTRSTYADLDYVRRDLEHAKELSREHGYTIIDITDRAMEEAASLIMSKLKERFPNCEFGDLSM